MTKSAEPLNRLDPAVTPFAARFVRSLPRKGFFDDEACVGLFAKENFPPAKFLSVCHFRKKILSQSRNGTEVD